MSFHVKVCAGAAVLVGAALAAIFLLMGGGEEAAIEKLIEGAAAAAERGDAEAVVAITSRDFKSRDHDYDGAVRRIRSVIGPDFRYGRVEARPAIHVQDQEAEATVRVRVGYGRNVQETLFQLKLRKEEGGWKVVCAEEVR